MNHVTFSRSYVTLPAFARIKFEAHQKIKIMPILTILIVLIVAGVILYLINNYIPMDRKIKSILNTVAVIVVIVWLLNVFGVFSYLKNINI